jgi:integrase
MMVSKINRSPVRQCLEGEDLGWLIDVYLTDARLRLPTPATAKNYAYLLGYLRTWWEGAGPGLGHELDRRAWQLFDLWLQGQQCTRSGGALALTTRKAILGKTRQLLRWAYRWGYMDRDWGDLLPALRGGTLPRRGPDLAGLAALLDAASRTRAGVRDQALVAVLAGCGLRRAEAAGLDVADVIFHADGGGVLIVRVAKMNKQRRACFDAICGRYLAAWLDMGDRRAGPLFTGWNGRRLSAHSVYRIVKRACILAGLDAPGRGPHDLRRLFATEWTRTRHGLGDGQLLAQQLGHTSPKTSLLYSGLGFDDLADGFTSPLSML